MPAALPTTRARRLESDGEVWSAALGRLLAGATLVLIGLRLQVGPGVSTGTLAGLALLPLWLPSLGRFWGMRVLFGLGVLSLTVGVWLTAVSRPHRPTSTGQLVEISMLLLGVLVAVGCVLWARRLMTTSAVAGLYGLGVLGSVAIRPHLLADNPWKFALAVPLTILVLALISRRQNRLAETLALLALAAASAVNDSRSYTALLLLSGALLLWTMRPLSVGRERVGALTILTLTTLVFVVYNIGSTAALEGYLGTEAQQRSAMQVQTSGSVILGGRPEIGATAGLLQHQWWGYGAGTQPTPADVLAAKSGMAELGYDPNNGYVERYMFGAGIELHAGAADLWAWFGLPGAALAGWMGWLLLRNLLGGLARRDVSALSVLLAVHAMWGLLFGPFYTDSVTLALALGMLVSPRTGGEAGYGAPLQARLHSDVQQDHARLQRPAPS